MQFNLIRYNVLHFVYFFPHEKTILSLLCLFHLYPTVHPLLLVLTLLAIYGNVNVASNGARSHCTRLNGDVMVRSRVPPVLVTSQVTSGGALVKYKDYFYYYFHGWFVKNLLHTHIQSTHIGRIFIYI